MPGAKANPRHEAIRRALAVEGEVGARELARRFGVTPMTIRRDLATLAAAGALRRTHGGAMPARPGAIDLAFREREERETDRKRAIAREAARLIRPGMSLSLDTGTTTLEVARALPDVRDLTVLTSSLAIAAALYARENVQLVVLGGTARKTRPDLYGDLTEENLKRFRVDLAFLGADAVTPEGIFTTDVEISRVSRAMVAKAERVVVVADSGKLSGRAFVKCLNLDEINLVITDDACPPEARKWLEAAIGQVTYCREE